MKKKASLWELLLAFMKISCFTFGGGYAMLGVIQHTAVEVKKWITNDEMMDVVVIAESTPGPIAINCATYVGYRQKGFWGSVIATLGMVFPSFTIIYIISMFLDRFLEITVIANAFRGIKLAVGLLIVNAALNMLGKMKKAPLSRGIFLVTCAVMVLCILLSCRISSIWLILAAGAVSLAFIRKGGRA